MNPSRRALLRGRFQTDAHTVRLPWAKADAVFTAQCTRCGDCVRACPEQIVRNGEGGFPHIDFNLGACTFCHACVDSCTQPIFQSDEKPWHAVAHISAQCLTQQNVFCQNCKDACDPRAIQFQFGRNGIAFPNILLDACTGCGACVAPCPTHAIQIQTESKRDLTHEC